MCTRGPAGPTRLVSAQGESQNKQGPRPKGTDSRLAFLIPQETNMPMASRKKGKQGLDETLQTSTANALRPLWPVPLHAAG